MWELAADLIVKLVADLVADWFVSILMLSSASLWSLLYYLCRRSRPKQNPNAPIWCLPTDLVIYIAEILPPASAAALVLTCRSMLNTIGRRSLSLKRKDRLELLTILQPDMPKHVLCHQCAIFHCKYSFYQQCHRKCALRATDGSCCLPFSWAQQIMNRHCYGPNHKLSAKMTYSDELDEHSRFSRRRTREFRITVNDLIIKQNIVVFFNHNDKLIKDREAFRYPYSICPHLWWDEVFNAKRLLSKAGIFLKCPVCQTEIRYRLKQVSEQQDSFHLTTWHLLGPCRHPSESQWRLVTEEPGQQHNPLYITKSAAAPIRLCFKSSPPLPSPF
ncbi:hypothetical protein VTN96DRAFT_5141 [Rasamsonia emersonii]